MPTARYVQEKFDEKMEETVSMVSEVPSALKEKVSEVPAAIKEKAKGLNWRQRYHLRSIKTFKVGKKSGWFEKLRKEIKDDDDVA